MGLLVSLFCFFFLRESTFKKLKIKEENIKIISLEDTKVCGSGMEGEHMINSSTERSESKQVLELRPVTLKAPWQAGSPANESRAQRKSSKSGLQPSIDLTFYSELYLNLTSPLGIYPILNKTEDKVVCVRKR